MYRNYTQGDAEIFMIHGVTQSDSIRQAVKFSLFFILLLICLLKYPKLFFLIIVVALAAIGLYKRSPGGFWFDLKFSLAKMAGMIVGMMKGVRKGRIIKGTMKK